jgi:TonB family protein
MKTRANFNLQGYINLIKVLPSIAIVLLLISSCSKSKKVEQLLPTPTIQPTVEQPLQDPPKQPTMDGNDTIWQKVELMPEFSGGDSVLLDYIGKNTVYPEIAKKNNIQGKVILRFCVNSKGSVTAVSVVRGVDPSLDAEAIRVVKTLPDFKPGKQDGKPVSVWYFVPITYRLK